MTQVISAGKEAVEAITSALGPRPARVLIDAAVADLPCTRRVVEGLPAQCLRTEILTGDAEFGEVSRLAASSPADSLIIGIGGGAVIDRAKLIALLASNPRLGRSLSSGHRSGFVLLSGSVSRTAGLIALPTTVGTGAEQSKTACLRLGDRKKLIYSPALQPDIAHVTNEATATLPRELFIEGIIEILLRVSNYYVGHRSERETGDALAEDLTAKLVRLGAFASASAGIAPAQVRRSVALLSGSTHLDAFHEGLAPFSDKCWPLANELSLATGIRKAAAMAALTPQLWRRITEREECWGSPERLARWWSILAEASGSTVADPAEGLARLLGAWGVAPVPTTDDPAEIDRRSAEISSRTAESWGRGLPMLSGVSEEELQLVFSRVSTRSAV